MWMWLVGIAALVVIVAVVWQRRAELSALPLQWGGVPPRQV